MKYEVGYIVACLENYEIMKHEYELAYMDLMKELSELVKNIISLGINYGERVQSSRISDTTYEMYARKEEKTRILQKRIDNVCESLDSIERIILVFKKLLSVVPKHYYVVDRMVFSDRSKITAMKMEMNKGCDTIKAMKENLFKAIGVVARTDYSNEQIIDLDPSEVWYLFDDDLEVALKKNEKG